jgi:hypothetical protein
MGWSMTTPYITSRVYESINNLSTYHQILFTDLDSDQNVKQICPLWQISFSFEHWELLAQILGELPLD